MNNQIRERVVKEASYILSTKSTLRMTAKYFGVSKSTVHLDMSKRLKKVNLDIFLKVSIMLGYNFSQKHIRGGKSTAEKYKKIRQIKQKNT